MDQAVHDAAVKAVEHINSMYHNKGYKAVREDRLGGFSIVTVEFYGGENERYINYALMKGPKVVGAFYFINDLVAHIDRRMSWQSLVVDQFGLVAGAVILILLIVGAFMVMATKTMTVPEPVWIGISSGVAFLLGAKGTNKSKGRRP